MAGLVIIGTAETALAARAALSATEDAPRPVGAILLDDARVDGRRLRVLGTFDRLAAIHDETGFDEALVSIPASMPDAAQRVELALRGLGVAIRRMPTVRDVLSGPAWRPRRDEIDLLGVPALAGRDQREPDPARLDAPLRDKRVLITGAGGSIGSELARLAAQREPALLVLMDRAENALFEIDRELRERHPHLSVRTVLEDVVDEAATQRVFDAARPQTVFHAAAHKHVPMMEDHPAHAISNNLFGTRSAAEAARRVGAERFVLVSTDKAVNPTSVMGSTKRLAERYVRGLGLVSPTRFCMVRFGNVLGSNGSVLTIWRKQVAEGGPVTVTDERMTRYFMTIPEAASLVVQASSLTPEEAGGADVFVLDMGRPVRVLDLAERLVRAHGLKPAMPGADEPAGPADGAIPIVFTGARPGEKLDEQLAHGSESLENTPVPGILAWRAQPPSLVELHAMTLDLATARLATDPRAALEALRRWTPTLAERAGLAPGDVRALTASAC